MAGVVFWFETFDKDIFSSRNPIDLDAWRYAMKAGGITVAKCVNSSLIESITLGGDMDLEIIGSNSSDLDDWITNHSSDSIVVIDTEWTCPQGAISISQLNHSTVDWYIFGASNGISPDYPAQYVYLPQSGIGALHSVHTCTAMMLRRWEMLN